MPMLAEQFAELSPDAKRRVHFLLGEQALAKWREYSTANPQVHYVELVCGTDQAVDNSLPEDAFACAQQEWDDRNVSQRYKEPITAMHDCDLDFPELVAFAYYAIYNLFQKYASHEPIDDWLIVNQALSSEADAARRRALLDAAIKNTQ